MHRFALVFFFLAPTLLRVHFPDLREDLSTIANFLQFQCGRKTVTKW